MAAVRIKSDKELAGLGLRVDPDDPTRLIPARRNDAGSPGGAGAYSAARPQAGHEGVGGGDPPRSAPPAAPAGGTPDNSGPIQVDPRIEGVLPPPSPSEAALLERRLLADRGQQIELAVWSDGWRLLDDFATYRLCMKHGITYSVRLVDLPDVEAAIRWRLEARLGQQNLSPRQVAWARGRVYHSERKRPGRPRKGEKQGQSVPKTTAERLGERWKVDAKTVRRDAAFANALTVIEDLLGVAFRDKILTREYPLTRPEVVAWGKDLRGRRIDEAEIGRRVAVILEQRRRKAEGPGATPPVAEPDQAGITEPASGQRPEPISDGAGSQDDVAPPLVAPTAGPVIIDAPPADTPLLQGYWWWDAASDEEKEEFARVPEVFDFFVDFIARAGGPAGA